LDQTGREEKRLEAGRRWIAREKAEDVLERGFFCIHSVLNTR